MNAWGFLTRDVFFRAGSSGWSEHTETYEAGTPVLVTWAFDPSTPTPVTTDYGKHPPAPAYRWYTLYRLGVRWQSFRIREDAFADTVRLDPSAECDRHGARLYHDNAAPADSDGKRGAERMYR